MTPEQVLALLGLIASLYQTNMDLARQVDALNTKVKELEPQEPAPDEGLG